MRLQVKKTKPTMGKVMLMVFWGTFSLNSHGELPISETFEGDSEHILSKKGAQGNLPRA